MPDYKVLTPIKDHDGLHQPGETITLTGKDESEMIVLGAVQAVEMPAELSAEERLAAIEVAISQLDPSNDDLWLRDGRPDTNALAALTGFKMSASERNAAWARVKPAE